MGSMNKASFCHQVAANLQWPQAIFNSRGMQRWFTTARLCIASWDLVVSYPNTHQGWPYLGSKIWWGWGSLGYSGQVKPCRWTNPWFSLVLVLMWLKLFWLGYGSSWSKAGHQYASSAILLVTHMGKCDPNAHCKLGWRTVMGPSYKIKHLLNSQYKICNMLLVIYIYNMHLDRKPGKFVFWFGVGLTPLL